ncbi:MAG: alanine racemase [Actinomycetota bacterium]
MSRWAWADIETAAVEHNVAAIVAEVAPAEVWAVVKANGYGHGAVSVARAALRAGATGVCVALVQEAADLRAASIDAPILVLSEQPPAELAAAVALDLDLTVYSAGQLAAIAGTGVLDQRVHLKIDTGMHRVGATPEMALQLADAIAASPATRLEGLFTHLAVADEPEHPFNATQLDRFDEVVRSLAAHGHAPRWVHAANTAAALALPHARRSMVRVGIGTYGLLPGPGVRAHIERLGLRPALSLHSRVSHVQRVAAGEQVSYGLRHTFPAATTVATVPIGYADGVPRSLHRAGEVLVGGQRCRIVGVVTMDQLMVDVGHLEVAVGDPVTLLGTQHGVAIRADEWAHHLGTIDYEIVCGVSERVQRRWY